MPWITTAAVAFFSQPFNCCCRYPRKANSSQIPAESDKNIQNVISIALRGSNLLMLAFGPGRKIACSPARRILEPTRNRTPIPTSRPNCFAVDHRAPITLSIEPPPNLIPQAASANSSHSQAIVNRYLTARDDPKAGKPCRCAPHVAIPPSASRNSAVCHKGAISLGEDGVGCAAAGAFMVCDYRTVASFAERQNGCP